MEDRQNMDVLKKVPVREQDAAERAANFEEVCLGYNQEEAQAEGAEVVDGETRAQEFSAEAAGHVPPPVGGARAQAQARAWRGPAGGWGQ